MNEVVIVAACRIAIGRHGSAFKNLSALELTLPVMKDLLNRSHMDPGLMDDVIWGCNYQKPYMENNIARVAAVKAGIPDTVPGITVHRNCTSSMSSLQMGLPDQMRGRPLIRAGLRRRSFPWKSGIKKRPLSSTPTNTPGGI